jgi:hypothetical protein
MYRMRITRHNNYHVVFDEVYYFHSPLNETAGCFALAKSRPLVHVHSRALGSTR